MEVVRVHYPPPLFIVHSFSSLPCLILIRFLIRFHDMLYIYYLCAKFSAKFVVSPFCHGNYLYFVYVLLFMFSLSCVTT